MRHCLLLGLLMALSVGVAAQNNRRDKDRYYSQFQDCADFGTSYDEWSTFVTANIAYGLKPSMSFGLTLGMIRRFGWFVSVMTSGSLQSFDVDGEFEPEGATMMPFLYGESKQSNTRLSLMIGGLVRIARPLSLRLGVGYGVNELCYATPDDKWYVEKDNSRRGMDMALGLQYDIKRLVISAEAVTTDFDMLEGKAGVGLKF
ncbi:MAG: hypothetical protein J5708_07165 [Bacteroidales bacterium]|nr:hypothetical protein [Bacteroidales bacterium]